MAMPRESMLSEKRRGLGMERILRKPTVRLRHEENCNKAFRVARGHDAWGRGGGVLAEHKRGVYGVETVQNVAEISKIKPVS